MIRATLAIEREIDDTLSIQGMGANAKRKKNQSFSSYRRSIRLLLLSDFKDRVMAMRVKAESGLLAKRGR